MSTTEEFWAKQSGAGGGSGGDNFEKVQVQLQALQCKNCGKSFPENQALACPNGNGPYCPLCKHCIGCGATH
jgi:NAD-dependent SIR2 family protein deacetylase